MTLRRLLLPHGFVALVDADDYEMVLAAGPWYPNARQGRRVYVQRHTKGPHALRKTQWLHSFLTGWPLVDHANGDGLDNRRANLRAATPTQNCANSRLRVDNKSGFKGVSRRISRTGQIRWHAQIQVAGHKRHLGNHDTPEDAARIYDEAARAAFGEFARLNFPVAVVVR